MPKSLFAAVAASVLLIAAIGSSSRAAAEPRLAALPAEVPAPSDNPTTPDRVALGRLLFWDPVLSGGRDVACATCHHPSKGYSDGLDIAIGANGIGLGSSRRFAPGHSPRPVKRNSQTVLNAAFNGLTSEGGPSPSDAPMFWDVRVKSLELQALEPLKALEEMRGEAYPPDQALSAVVARLQDIAEYRELFARAFGGVSPVNELNLGRAIAAFERTLVASNSPFDRYMRGDTHALNGDQRHGLEQFEAVGCVNCHNGPMLSDFKPHVLGVPANPKLANFDFGIGDRYAFRTASLRNLGSTAPYMHSGVFETLPDVIAFYFSISRRRGDGMVGGANPQVFGSQIDPLARDLKLRPGLPYLVAFLRAMDDPRFDRTIPKQVPSRLPVGGPLAR